MLEGQGIPLIRRVFGTEDVAMLSRSAVVAVLLLMGPPLLAQNTRPSAGIFHILQRDVVSRADLSYEKPAGRSEAGLPVGNGRMGSLVWTAPSSLKLQINRGDTTSLCSIA